MKILITGKNINIGDALRGHTESKVKDLTEKYSVDPVECAVVVSKDAKHAICCQIDMHLGREVFVRVHADSDDAHFSVDDAVEKLEKQLRRHKNRLVDHHKKKGIQLDTIPAQQYVISHNSEDDNAGDDLAPLIIAEQESTILSLSVSEAVMRMDLGDMNALMFLNNKENRINVVYRRPDGNIGWIDPVQR